VSEARINSQKLRVVIHAAGMPFDGDTVKTQSLGGSESAAYYMARELASRGHHVVCFTSKPGNARVIDGVTYICHGEPTQNAPLGMAFDHYASSAPCDLLLIQRSPIAFHKPYNAKVCVWQLHDLPMHRVAHHVIQGTWQIDAVTCVSDWHKELVKKVWNINPDVLYTVPNGVDPALYDGSLGADIDIKRTAGPPWNAVQQKDGSCWLTLPKDKFLLLYQSRPERGLENALMLMEKAALIGLPIHLLTCTYQNVPDHMRDYYAMLDTKADALPNVTRLGALSKPQLAALQKECDLLLYPTAFEEVSCITAMEAMHARLPMLTSEHAALPETCKDSGTVFVPMKDGEVDVEAFDKKLQEWFGMALPGQYPEELQELRKKQDAAAASRGWSNAADGLERVYARCIAKRTANLDAVIRDAIEHSDIRFAKHVCSKFFTPNGVDKPTLITAALKHELSELYDFAEDQDKYAAHYAKHQTAYYDEFENQVIGEDVTRTTRYIGVRAQIAEHLGRVKKPLRILDYGCAHGHYTMRLAKDFPECEFIGMDISTRAVSAANKWRLRDDQKNVEFLLGAQDALTDEIGEFDLVLAGEVLEHVWDYLGLLNKFRERLAHDGAILVTTPLGRWEHTGTVPFRKAREHLHHFDRDDIEEICAGHEVSILHAPAGQDQSGFSLGSWVWIVWPKLGTPLHSVDYNRKLLNYAPRQTITACLIVKDGEKTLRRCVESFVDWVDEIVIAIDPTTADDTLAIAYKLEKDFPFRAFNIFVGKSATKDGFAAARNETVTRASGQWILWIDADEELRAPWAMHRLARPSMHNGYGFAQVHYSVDPDQVLTVDYPCRFFRNGLGIKFYGYVHEHPEQELGKAIPWSLVRPEMKFLHHGYFDEQTRRQRFERNLPLLLRDIAEYPTQRPLNQFLHLRDLAQSVRFSLESTGAPPPGFQNKCMQGIAIMEKLVDHENFSPKMITDALQYYSMLVSMLNTGFDVNVTIQAKHPQAPDLAVNYNVQGRFHTRDFFAKLVNKLNQETTKLYEERYF
jgi:glycosyltransferase involved in cell wall biosynthesis/2-polyprenyl-3-methyl-5-hydroxy-6-metoxy-1,4-benzoquinol methylase